MQFTLLGERALIRLSGGDVVPFLQGLVTNDVRKLAEKGAMYAALLSPQGKFLHDFFLIQRPDAIWIDCEKARRDDLIARLRMYKLRSKVVIELLPHDMGVAAIWGAQKPLSAPEDSVALFCDPRLPVLGWRMAGDINTMEHGLQAMTRADEAAYDLMRLEIGVPDGSRDLIVDKSTIIPFGFEALHGVDFSKGCYVGQEVTARTKHLGHNRKLLCKIRSVTGTLPASGATIMAGQEKAGTLCSHAGNKGLALMQMESMERAKNADVPLQCDDVILTAELPDWLLMEF